MKNILISWRHIKNDKVNSIINIVGLGIALGVFAVAMVFVSHEYSYNRCFKDSNRIYKFISNNFFFHNEEPLPYSLADIILDDFPQVEDAIAIGKCYGLETEKDNHRLNISGTTSHFFSMFGIKVLEGDITRLDNSLTALVLTQKEAKLIFGEEKSYVGKTLPVKWERRKGHYGEEQGEYVTDSIVLRRANMEVVAIIADCPENVTFNNDCYVSPEFLINSVEYEEKSIEALKSTLEELDYSADQFDIYIKLNKSVDAEELEPRLNDIKKNRSKAIERFNFSLKALTRLHFEQDKNSERISKTTFIIGLLILLIAFFNYVNLASATADRRLRTQAICQINGAQTGNIVWQSIVESLMLIVLSLPLSVLVAIYGLPKLCALFEIDAELSFFGNFATIATIWTTTSALFGLFSGLAIMFRLRRISLADAVKSSVIKTGDRLVFTNILTIIQIAVFCGLFASILIMDRQIKYALKADLGFDQDGLIVVDTRDGQYPIFKEEMKKMPGIVGFSGASISIFRPNSGSFGVYDDSTKEVTTLNYAEIDENFFNTVGAKILEGDLNIKTGFVVCNQKAKEKHHWEIGTLVYGGTLQGVVSDFNFNNAHDEVTDIVYCYPTNNSHMYSAFLRVNLMQTPNIVSDIEKVWKKTFPDTDFNWYFADAKIAESYQKDRNYSFVISALTIIALFIAIIGIIGLSTALNQKRVKEIGIRKVNGATTAEILTLLCRRYIWIVAVAIAISVPCAYSFVAYWLKDFAYKISITPVDFIISAIVTLLLVLTTVAVQSHHFARRNPVEAIKTE